MKKGLGKDQKEHYFAKRGKAREKREKRAFVWLGLFFSGKRAPWSLRNA